MLKKSAKVATKNLEAPKIRKLIARGRGKDVQILPVAGGKVMNI